MRELFFSRLRHVLSHGVSAPVFVSSAQMAEVVSTREGSLLGVGVHFHGVEVFSRPTQELWHRKSSGKFLEEILLGWILMNQNSQMNKCRKGSPDRERAQPGTIRRQVSKRASARSWRYRRLCWGIWPDPGHGGGSWQLRTLVSALWLLPAQWLEIQMLRALTCTEWVILSRGEVVGRAWGCGKLYDVALLKGGQLPFNLSWLLPCGNMGQPCTPSGFLKKLRIWVRM